MTINQAIDLLYNYHDIDAFPEAKDLRHKLSMLKMEHGGNMQIENPELISEVIQRVEENPKNQN